MMEWVNISVFLNALAISLTMILAKKHCLCQLLQQQINVRGGVLINGPNLTGSDQKDVTADIF